MLLKYTNGKIAFIQTEEGRAVPDSTGNYNYEYTLADHLGNSGVSFITKGDSAVVVQQDDYMPFGMEISGLYKDPKNEYLYNKKELQEETGLYDYGSRFYDPLIAKWTTIDPLSESSRRFSPYNYVLDNPIRFVDPDGMSEEDDLLNDKSFENNSDKRVKMQHDIAAAQSKENTTYNYDDGDKDDDGNCCKTIGPAKRMPKPEKVEGSDPTEDEEKAELINKVGTVATYTGIVLDVTEDASKAQKILKLAKIAHVGSVTTILIGTAADAYLTTHVDPKTGQPYVSHVMAGANLGVAVVALVVGGPVGIGIEVGYASGKLLFDYIEKNYPHALDMEANPAL